MYVMNFPVQKSFVKELGSNAFKNICYFKQKHYYKKSTSELHQFLPVFSGSAYSYFCPELNLIWTWRVHI